MPKPGPFALLARRLDPLTEELHRATPWRVDPPRTVESWLVSLTWEQLEMCDLFCTLLAREPHRLPGPLCEAPAEGVRSPLTEPQLLDLSRQMMHRLLFASDLARRMSPTFRRGIPMTGDFASDLHQVLAWRTSAARNWATQFGPRYQ